MGLPFPAGPTLERMALDGQRLLPLPYSVKGMDVAFSGMLTAAAQLMARGADQRDLALSVQETAFGKPGSPISINGLCSSPNMPAVPPP